MTTTLHFGQDSGILGVGAPEIAVTLLVGYFVLGPSDLYKLVKEIGKFIQNVRTLGSEAAKSFEGTMENQLELTELRKAQRELNAAFNFRRSINTDELSDAFDKTGKFGENSSSSNNNNNNVDATTTTTAIMTEGEMAMSASGMVGGEILPSTTTKKRKLVRRKKKQIVEIREQEVEEEARGWDDTTYPDLDALGDVVADDNNDGDDDVPPLVDDLRAERMRRLMSTDNAVDNADDTMSEEKSPPIDWYNMSNEDVASATLLSNNNNNINNNIDKADEAVEAAAAAARFQSQLSIEQWNAQMMANENDALSPLSMAMQRLALLEDEKNVKDALIEEEYRKRLDNEDEYYSMKRMVIMDAISEIQNNISSSISESSDTTTTTATTTKIIGVNGHNNDDDNNKEDIDDDDDDDDDESSMMSTKEELENWARSTKFSL
jgi:Sec-independent protein translocase protein TatA